MQLAIFAMSCECRQTKHKNFKFKPLPSLRKAIVKCCGRTRCSLLKPICKSNSTKKLTKNNPDACYHLKKQTGTTIAPLLCIFPESFTVVKYTKIHYCVWKIIIWSVWSAARYKSSNENCTLTHTFEPRDKYAFSKNSSCRTWISLKITIYNSNKAKLNAVHLEWWSKWKESNLARAYFYKGRRNAINYSRWTHFNVIICDNHTRKCYNNINLILYHIS